MNKRIFKSIFPEDWVDENFSVIERSDIFNNVASEFYEYLLTPQGRSSKNDFRGKIFNFVEKNGNIAAGRTNVNVMGNYILGTPPDKNTDVVARMRRIAGEQMYASACCEAFNQYAKDTGFKHRTDEDYTSRKDALMALEADSIAGKGPYDNATPYTAINTVDTVLSNAAQTGLLPEEYHYTLQEGLNQRYEEYSRYTHRSYDFKASDYCEHMRKHGLKSTMRGFPFFAAGNSKMKEYWYDLTKWMFRNTPVRIAEIKWKGRTVDEFIQDVLVDIEELNLEPDEWFGLEQTIIIPISRNQGSAFKTKWKGDKIVLTGERKDMKYRIVTPIAAFVQALSILACDDLVRNAKYTEGRIGMQDPDTNKRRMNEFIQSSANNDLPLISTDFTAYDSTLMTQLMCAEASMYAELYDSVRVKRGFVIAGLSLANKLMLLPVSISEVDKPYNKFHHFLMKNIKGVKSFNDKKIKKQLMWNHPDTANEKVSERYDFKAVLFYIFRSYLPSGHILTNTTGSDCTLLLSRNLVPAKLEIPGKMRATASGDDCVQQILGEIYRRLGMEGVYDLLEQAYSTFYMIVNAKKQIKIKYKGLPLVDFLQHPYIQGPDSETIQDEYRKWMRQMGSWPVCERRSKLNPILQNVSVLGKAESGICSENVDMAAHITLYAGRNLHKLANMRKYHPIVHKGLLEGDPLFYNRAYAIDRSDYLGLEQLLGLVKSYGQDLISNLGKYAAEKFDDIVADFESELETRAPHREVLARAFFKSLGKDAYEEAGGDYRFGTGDFRTHFYSIEAFEKLLNFEGVEINPVVLDKPLKTGRDAGFQSDALDESQDPDNYEFDDGPSD
jgi:hypothetical protein